jgi:hypothetical protein
MNDRQSERYEVEVQIADSAVTEVTDCNDLDEAMAVFYTKVGENYSEPSYNIAVHDLVAGKTLANWWYNPDDEVGKVLYDTPTPVLGN